MKWHAMSESVYRRESSTAAAKERLPWLIDIFLYPISAAGLTMLGLFVIVPFVLTLFLMGLQSLGLGVIMRPLGFLLFLVVWVIRFYMFWYLGFCVRESAEGHFRAPDNIAPGFDDSIGETFEQMLLIVGTVALFLLPSIVYYLVSRSIDTRFWLIMAGGGFFMPMALLSVIMQDGFWGLNPFRIIFSILRTFVRYCLVVPVFYLPIAIIAAFIIHFYRNDNAVTFLLFRTAYVYLLIVASHVLGRFYYRNEAALDWF